MKAKKFLSLIIAAVMLLPLVPVTSFAAIGDGYGQCPHHTEHTKECGYLTSYTCTYVCETCIAETEALVNALPSMTEISEMDNEEKAAVFTAVDNIDRAKLNLSDAGRDEIDWTKYDEACFALYMPDGYFGGWGCKVDCINGVEVPLNGPKFAFLNESGNRQNVLYTDLNSSPELLTVDENGESEFFYLPAGTYEIEEIVEGDWTLSTKVNGVSVQNNTFTGVAGGIYEIDLLNTADPVAKVIDPESGAEFPFNTIEEAVALAATISGCTLLIVEDGYESDFAIPSGCKFNLEAKNCYGTVTIEQGADITIPKGTFKAPGVAEYSIINRGKLTIKLGEFGLVKMDEGFGESSVTGGTFKGIEVYTKSSTDESTNLTINNGQFNKVSFKKPGVSSNSAVAINKLLSSDYAFRENKLYGKWIGDDIKSYEGGVNTDYITPRVRPIKDASSSIEGNGFYYGNNVEMKITDVTLGTGYTGRVPTYKWYKGTTEVDPPCTESVYNTTATNVGVREDYYCYITLDDYVFKHNFQFTARKATPVPPTVSALNATYGQSLNDIKNQLPEGFSWEDSGNTKVGNVGPHTFNATYTPDDLTHYNKVENIPITVNVAKATPTVTTLPKQNGTLYYNRAEQELFAPGVTSGGTLVYSFSEEGPFTESVLKAKDADEYTVYYKIKGNDNYNETGVSSFKAKIEPLNIIADAQVILGAGLAYDGTLKTQTVTKVSYGGVDLTTDDYEVSDNQNINAGDYTLKVKGKGNYAGIKEVAYTIERADASYTVPTAKSLTYTGSEAELVNPGTSEDGTFVYSLTETGPFTSAIPKGKDAKDYRVYYKLDPNMNHKPTAVSHVDVTIAKKALGDDAISAIADQDYTGSAVTPGVTVTGLTGTLTSGTDYSVSYENNINAGTATAKVTFLNTNYTGTLQKTFKILPKALGDDAISAIADQDYTGSAVTPAITVTGLTGTLTSGTDYSVSYENNINVGTAKAKVTLLNTNYTGTLQKTFKILPKALGNDAISAIADQIYTSSAITPTLTVKDGETVVPSAEYSVSYTNNIEVGRAQVTVTDVAGGNYTVNATASFNIVKRPVEGGTVGTFAPLTYDGTPQTPSATVMVAGITATGYWSPVTNTYDKTVFTATGNFTDTISNIDPGMTPAQITLNTAKAPAALVGLGEKLETAEIIDTEFFAPDGTTPLEGTFEWTNKTKVMEEDGTEEVTFTPTNKNYASKTIQVEVTTYAPDGSKLRYRVSFNTNGGSAIVSQTVIRNNKANEPKAPTKDGFTFAGWYSDEELSQGFSFDTKITKDLTLYAKWTLESTGGGSGGSGGSGGGGGGGSKKDPAGTDNDNGKTDEGENQGSGSGQGKDPGKTQPKDEWENPFVDVKDNDWFFEGVKYVHKNGLMTGTSEKTFSPNETLTRAMLVTILYRAEGSPKVDKSALAFTDVAADSYYTSAVIWAQQNGIVNGTGDKTFSPEEPVTREQMATIIKRYAEKKGFDVSVGEDTNILSYTDALDISEYAMEAIAYAVGSGLMKGKTESTINPKDSVTRAEMATILKRLLEDK